MNNRTAKASSQISRSSSAEHQGTTPDNYETLADVAYRKLRINLITEHENIKQAVLDREVDAACC